MSTDRTQELLGPVDELTAAAQGISLDAKTDEAIECEITQLGVMVDYHYSAVQTLVRKLVRQTNDTRGLERRCEAVHYSARAKALHQTVFNQKAELAELHRTVVERAKSIRELNGEIAGLKATLSATHAERHPNDGTAVDSVAQLEENHERWATELENEVAQFKHHEANVKRLESMWPLIVERSSRHSYRDDM